LGGILASRPGFRRLQHQCGNYWGPVQDLFTRTEIGKAASECPMNDPFGMGSGTLGYHLQHQTKTVWLAGNIPSLQFRASGRGRSKKRLRPFFPAPRAFSF